MAAKKPKKTISARGPVARKVISTARQHLQKKVTLLSEWREAKIRAEDYQKTIITPNQLTEYDPLHGIYIYAQNQLSVMIEQLMELPPLAKLADIYSSAEDEYMPSGPPMSPLTGSYFFGWGCFDLCTTGAKPETLATIAVDLCRFLSVDESLLTLYETLQASRMGVYAHQGHSDRYVILRELITDETVKVIVPAGYTGRASELWYARVLPPPFRAAELDYSLVFTTPYILGSATPTGTFRPAVESEWLDFFQRQFDRRPGQPPEQIYRTLMKNGQSRHYWNEYVFSSYHSHSAEMILLAGIPDQPHTLPHAASD